MMPNSNLTESLSMHYLNIISKKKEYSTEFFVTSRPGQSSDLGLALTGERQIHIGLMPLNGPAVLEKFMVLWLYEAWIFKN
jgi:hypothetical protein